MRSHNKVFLCYSVGVKRSLGEGLISISCLRSSSISEDLSSHFFDRNIAKKNATNVLMSLKKKGRNTPMVKVPECKIR